MWYFTAPKLENGINGFADDSALIGRKFQIEETKPLKSSMKSGAPQATIIKTKKQVRFKDGVPYSFDSETEPLVTPLDLLQNQSAKKKTPNQAIAIIAAGYKASVEMNDELIGKYESLIARNKMLESQVAQSLAREEQLKQAAKRAEISISRVMSRMDDTRNLNESTLSDFSLGNLKQDTSDIAAIRARYGSQGRSGVAAGSPGIDNSFESYDSKQRTRTFSDVSEIACDSMDQSSILGK